MVWIVFKITAQFGLVVEKVFSREENAVEFLNSQPDPQNFEIFDFDIEDEYTT